MKTLPSRALFVLSLLAASPALAQPADAIPPFRGPPEHAGAWQNEHAWAEAFEGDVAKGSYAYAYQGWARARADRHVEEQTRLDCADLSIDLLCEFAALHRLPVTWRVYYPKERRFISFSNDDSQFASPAAFARWSRYYLGAMNLADNTDAISYDVWAGGDMVLMDWNQSEEWPNFDEGREVWHTYLIGAPDEVIYYGNISDGEPLPVTRVTGGSRMEMVRTHPDRHGYSPRRYRLFRDAVWAPGEEPAPPPQTRELATVIRAWRLNLREGPGTEHAVVGRAARGEQLAVVGREGRWVRLALADGREVWAHGYYLELDQVDVTPAPVLTGIAGALGEL